MPNTYSYKIAWPNRSFKFLPSIHFTASFYITIMTACVEEINTLDED